mgnify:CR=1 FL=1
MKHLKLRTIILVLFAITFSINASAQWNQIGDDIDGEATGVGSGHAVSINSDGTIVAIAPRLRGLVRVFKNNGGTWQQIGSGIKAEQSDNYDGNHISINADGTVIAFGSHDNNTVVCDSVRCTTLKCDTNICDSIVCDSVNCDTVFCTGGVGGGSCVNVYEYVCGEWVKKGNTIFRDSSNGSWDGFSVKLSSNGNIVAIGDPFSNEKGSRTGHARVFEYSGSKWTQIGGNIVGDTTENWFGHSVSLSSDGSILAVGAIYYFNQRGQAKVFENVGGNWQQIGSAIVGEAPVDYFGHQLDISADGSIIAIGAPGNDGTGLDASNVRVFKNDGGDWTQLGNNLNGMGDHNQIGFSVSLSSDGSRVVFGGRFGGFINSGTSKVYEYLGNRWIQIGNVIEGEGNEDYAGTAVSISDDGNIVIVGAQNNDGNGTNSGHARIFENCGSKGFLSEVACSTYTSPSGDSVWTDSGTYFDVIPNTEGCDSIIVIDLDLQKPFQNQQLCFVTVDTSVGKNKIIWEGKEDVGTEYYLVYKAVSTDVYNSIGSVNAKDPHEFIDYASDPMVHSDVYKITVVDTCGNQSEIDSSVYHKTINLTISNVGSTMSLNWEEYEVEDGSYIPSYYYIYRGTTINNLLPLDTVIGMVHTYNDLNVNNLYHYMVGASRNGCNGAKSLYSLFSNKVDNSGLLPIENHKFNENYSYRIYPNPTTSIFSVKTVDIEKIEIINDFGQIVLETNKGTNIDVGDLPDGIYFIKVTTNANSIVKKLVKQ